MAGQKGTGGGVILNGTENVTHARFGCPLFLRKKIVSVYQAGVVYPISQKVHYIDKADKIKRVASCKKQYCSIKRKIFYLSLSL